MGRSSNRMKERKKALKKLSLDAAMKATHHEERSTEELIKDLTWKIKMCYEDMKVIGDSIIIQNKIKIMQERVAFLTKRLETEKEVEKIKWKDEKDSTQEPLQEIVE